MNSDIALKFSWQFFQLLSVQADSGMVESPQSNILGPLPWQGWQPFLFESS